MIAKSLERFLKKEAKQRQVQGSSTSGKGKKASASGKFPEPIIGDTRDKVGETVGLSGKTYEKAKAVVKAAEADVATTNNPSTLAFSAAVL